MDPDVPLGTLTMSHQPGTAFLSGKNSVLLRMVPSVNEEGEMCLAIYLKLTDVWMLRPHGLSVLCREIVCLYMDLNESLQRGCFYREGRVNKGNTLSLSYIVV